MTGKVLKRGKGRPAADGDLAVDEQLCMEVSLDTFAEFGFEGTSVREISRRLGISHSLLNAKYGSKQALWALAFDFGMERLHARMAAFDTVGEAGHDLPGQLRQVSLNFLLGLVDSPAIF
ncbi:MAG: helix-turn-helix transcriptional regulator, partial [Hyphomonas sp.]|nr:helix-turn-helix transcriptional regulator [Hyphomonas sp.]